MRKTLTLAVLMAGAAGCLDGADPDVATTSQAVEIANGTSVNGTSVNGTSVNGTSVNGTSVNGTSVNGTSVNGTSVNGTSLNGTSVNGTSVDGSTWTATTSSGATVQLRIDASYTGTDSNSDVGMYAVSYKNSGAWYPLCADSNGTPILALAVMGTWDLMTGAYTPSSTTFTWACRGSSIAKCVELGYKTWLDRTPQLLACVRMLRADYCGTGVSYTVDGTIIDLYDNIGVQDRTQYSWIPEAEWLPTGARCLTDRAVARFTNLGLSKPACLKGARMDVTAACGASFSSGALLIDSLPESAYGTDPTSGSTTTTTTTTSTLSTTSKKR